MQQSPRNDGQPDPVARSPRSISSLVADGALAVALFALVAALVGGLALLADLIH